MEGITWQALLAAIGVLGTIFTVYKNFFSRPDELAAVNDAILSVRIEGLTQKLDEVLTNDMPHIDAKVESLRIDIQNTGKEIVRLGTIIEERIPKK